MVRSDRFAAKTAIVTGAASGIGLAAARRLHDEGANVVIADLSAALTTLGGELLPAYPRITLAPCDVTIDEDIESTCAMAMDKHGSIDVLVNNAGVMVFKPVAELTRADWLQQMDVNVFGAAVFTRTALRYLKAGSAIVNVSSVHARQTTANVAAYAAAKAALDSLTRSTAIEILARGIRANAVLPGAVDTPMLHASPNIKAGLEKLDPKDIAQPAEIAAAIAFLASDDASFVTGASFAIDGGRLARL